MFSFAFFWACLTLWRMASLFVLMYFPSVYVDGFSRYELILKDPIRLSQVSQSLAKTRGIRTSQTRVRV